MNITSLKIGIILQFLTVFILCGFSESKEINGLRDTVLWFRGLTDTECIVEYNDWYAGSSTINYIYFQAPDGTLIEKIKIDPGHKRGVKPLSFSKGGGDYRLEIPGYFHRIVKVQATEKTPVVIEPAKFHFSLHAGSTPLFFFVPDKTETFTLCGKYYKGVEAIEIFNPNGRKTASLSLSHHGVPLSFDSIKIEDPVPGAWRIEFRKKGKVGFWLDGIHNYFALSPEDLFVPALKKGTAFFKGRGEIKPMGVMGASLVNLSQNPAIFKAIDYMGLSSFNYYINHKWREPESAVYPSGGDNSDPDIINPGGFRWEDERIRFYRNKLGAQISGLFDSSHSWLGIPLTQDKQKEFAEFVLAYLSHFNADNSLGIAWVSPWDEANLKDFTYDEYEQLVFQIGKRLKSVEAPEAVQRTKLLAVSSSGFESINHGPGRTGEIWAEKLYALHDKYVDGIAFDYWDKKDLIESWRFKDAVSRAASVIARNDTDGAQTEDIVINQTSMSAGKSSSPYDVNTHWGARWLAGAVCNAFSQGQLNAFHYFTTVDDKKHMKGLIYADKPPESLPYLKAASPFDIKPIGHAMAMVNETVLDQIILLDSDSLEVDALFTVNMQNNELALIVVNKFERINEIKLEAAVPEKFKQKKFNISGLCFNPETEIPVPLNFPKPFATKEQFEFSFLLQPQTIYALSFKKL